MYDHRASLQPAPAQRNLVSHSTTNSMQQPRMMSGVSQSRPLMTSSQSFAMARMSGSSASLRPPVSSAPHNYRIPSPQRPSGSRQANMQPPITGMRYIQPPMTPERMSTSPRLASSTPQRLRQPLNFSASSASIGASINSPRRPMLNMPSSTILGANPGTRPNVVRNAVGHDMRQDARHAVGQDFRHPGHAGHPQHAGHPGHPGHAGHPGHHGHARHAGHPGHPGHAGHPVRHDVKQGARQDVRHEVKHDVRHEVKHDGRHEVKHDGRHEVKHDGRHEVKHDGRHEVKHDGRHEVKHDGRQEVKHDGRQVQQVKQSGRPNSESLCMAVDGGRGVTSPRPSSQLLDRSRLVVNLSNNSKRRLTDVYDIDSKDVLGQGTYGAVCKGTNKTTRAVRAIKTTSKKDVKNWERFQVEIDIMRSLDHPNIVKLFETLEDSANTYLVMEICNGGELFDRIVEEGTFTERNAAAIMKQIFSAVGYLHSRKFTHRDLKPENFLFASRDSTSDLKIIDFGLATRYTDGVKLKTKAGTPYYVAPEVLKGSYTHKCDVWSCGVIMYVMLCGYPPFFGDTDAEILNKVKKKEFDFPAEDWASVTKDAKSLIVQMLHRDEDKRLEFSDALQNIWIKELAPGASSKPLNSAVVNKFRSWRNTNRMKKIALTAIAQQLPQKEIKDMKDTFVMLDENGDGMLTLEEIKTGALAHQVQLPDDFEKIFHELDSDGSGAIDYTEFIAATMNKKTYMKESVCRAAFSIFDLDGDGKITRSELRTVLGNSDVMADLGEQFGSFSLEDMIDEVDVNGDGEIDFDEFMQMMEQGA